MSASMADWDSHIVRRFRVLLNVSEISGGTGAEDIAGDDDEAKLKRAAITRDRCADRVRTVHETLTALAFSGYQDWCAYDDDDWTRNCLGQVLDDDQNSVLIQALQNAGPAELQDAIEKMADTYCTAWQQAAENEAAQAVLAGATVTDAGLVPAENAESWKYSRTPGTRYYIFYDDQYLYCDDRDAPLASWATAEDRDEEAANRAAEWETGSGIYYTSYENPAHVGDVTHVFGLSQYGPWNLDQAQAADQLAGIRQARTSGAVGTASQMPASCGNAKACFSVSARTAWLKTASGTMKVKALGGRASHPTPIGNHFKVISKDAHHRSSKYKDKTGQLAAMPFYVNFAPEVGFHAGSLSEESHGCVHLSQADAETFFNHLQVGDPVAVIH